MHRTQFRLSTLAPRGPGTQQAAAGGLMVWRGRAALCQRSLDSSTTRSMLLQHRPGPANRAECCSAFWGFDSDRLDRLHARHRPPRCYGPDGLANFSPSRSLTLPEKTSRPGLALRRPRADPDLQCHKAKKIAGNNYRKEESTSP
jgi:hypothetical protein